MAYGLKYQSDFYNFFHKLVSVKIYKKDYVGIVTSLRTSEVTIEANYEDDNTPIIGHGAKIVVRADTTDLAYLEDLLLSYERQFECTITYDGTVAFRGYSLCDLNERQLLPFSAVTLQFTDYLHRLSEEYPICLKPPSGKITALRLVEELINLTNLDLSLYVNSTLFEDHMDQSDIDTFLPQTLMQNYQFYSNSDEYDSMYDSINKALQPFNAFVYYYNDMWVIERQEDISRPSNENWVMYSNESIGDLAIAAGTWVYLYGTIDYYPTGVYVQSWGNKISFTALVAGVDFYSPPSITNTEGDLSGTVATTTPNAGNALSVQFTFDSGAGEAFFIVGPCSGSIQCYESGNYYSSIEQFVSRYHDEWLALGVTMYHTMSHILQFDSSDTLGGITYDFGSTYGYIVGHFDVLVQGEAPVARVDVITLTGTNGHANIACNGVIRQVTMEFASEPDSGFGLSDPSSVPSLRQALNKQDGDFEYVECSQIIEYDSGLHTLILRLNDTLYDSLVFNNYTEDMQTVVFDDTTFITFPELEYRTWYANSEVTNIMVGKAFRGMNDWVRFTTDAAHKSIYYNFKVQFAVSTDVPTILTVNYKQTVPSLPLETTLVRLHFLLQLVGGKYDGWFVKAITPSPSQLYYDGEWHYNVGDVIAIYQSYDGESADEDPCQCWTNHVDISITDGSLEWTMNKELDFTGIKCKVHNPRNISSYTVYDSLYEALDNPLQQSFNIIFMNPSYSQDRNDGFLNGFFETAYYGDIAVTCTADTIDNKIEYHLNEDFVKKEEIELSLFDLDNINYSNGLMLDDGETYTKHWTSQNSTTPIPLYELFGKCKFRKYGRTIHRLKGTILTDRILKVFAILTDDTLLDNSENNLEFFVNGFTWDLNAGTYDIQAEEYTEEDIIVAGVSYDSTGNEDIYMPDPVTGLFITLGDTRTEVRIEWAASAGTLIGYQVQRKPHYSVIQGIWADSYMTVYDGTATHYHDNIDNTGPGNLNGMTFTYRVRAYNSAGYGSWSTTQSIDWLY